MQPGEACNEPSAARESAVAAEVSTRVVFAEDRPRRTCERGLFVRRLCIGGLCATWVIAILCGVLSCVTLIMFGVQLNTHAIGPKLGSFLSLAIAAAVTLLHETLGYIHTIALRWALWKEGRLRCNTSLRLFTAARRSFFNNWLSNIIYLFALAISYASAVQIVQDTVSSGYEPRLVTINLVSAAVLMASLLVQAAITTGALLSTNRDILSWSPGALNTALICLDDRLSPELGHSMVPVVRKTLGEEGLVLGQIRPSKRQPRLLHARTSAELTIIYLWMTFIASLIWAITCHVVKPFVTNSGTPQASNVLHRGGSVNFIIGDYSGTESVNLPSIQKLISLAFIVSLQFYITVGLHAAELLVNATRDEDQWRQASDRNRGAAMIQNAITSALKSKETVVLSILKTVIHWAFGEAVILTWLDHYNAMEYASTDCYLYVNALWLLTALTGILAMSGRTRGTT